MQNTTTSQPVSKVAEVTFMFWIMKIIATTLGETSGDFLAQTLGLGYWAGLAITGAILAAAIWAQVRAATFHTALFWTAIVATTMAGTEISDLIDRTLGLGYTGGAALLTAGLLVSLAVWFRREGNVRIDPIAHKAAEVMFWTAVLFSNSLGTAFGDFLSDVLNLGYAEGALVTMGVIGVVAGLHYKAAVNEVALFWIAFVFTRPFGATFGDLLTKPLAKGGLNLGTLQASCVALALMVLLVLMSHRSHIRRLSMATA